MARNFVKASSEYFTLGSAILTAYPLTFACWAKTNTAAAEQFAFTLALDDRERLAGLSVGTDLKVYAGVRAANSSSNATTSATVTSGVWHHLCGVWTNTSSRDVYLDGGNKVSNTITRTPSTPTSTQIANRLAEARHWNGDLAEWAVWNVSLTDAEIEVLAHGVSPYLIRPAALIAYYPLQEASGNALDFSGSGFDMTDTNTVGVADHPAVIYPWYDDGDYLAIAAGGGPTPGWLNRNYWWDSY